MILLISDTQVRKVFDKLRAEDPAMWHVVDASMSLDDVTAKVVTFPANA
jgi:thymidylate kinase